MSRTEAQNLKQLVKAAVLEALDERKDFLQATIAEVIEDIGLGRAMDAADTEYASRKEIDDLLARGE
jgi:hypothetical protein